MFVPALFLCSLGLFLWLLARSRELFRVSIRDGKPRLTRGYAPVGLLNDFGSAVRHVERATLRAYRAGDFARLELSGQIDENTAQRLRNLLSLYPLARLRSPRRRR